MNKGKIVSINISDRKGIKKRPVSRIILKENYGVCDDAHASSTWHRQVSILAFESIQKIVEKGLQVGPGDFAENITTDGIDVAALKIGERVSIGGDIELEITQIGKVCHSRCAIFRQAGDCIMPKEGVFARVIKGGIIKKGDTVKLLHRIND